jgi:hypothetical protein
MIRKGTLVYLFQDYDRKGTCAVYTYTVGSWGKVQGHLVKGSGKTREVRVYVNDVNSHIVPVSDVADPTAFALELAAKFRAAAALHLAGCLERWPDAGAGYIDAIKQDIIALHEPRVLFPVEN